MVSQFVKAWRVSWMTLSSIAIIAVVVMLLWPPPERQVSAKPAAQNTPEACRLSAEGDILIPKGSPLEEKLEVVEVRPEDVSYPVLRVTGSTVARLVDGSKAPEDRWQFSSEELSSTYAEWLKAQTEVDNAKKQLNQVQQLTETTVVYKTAVVERLKKLYASGTEARKEVVAAEAELAQAKLQGQKDVYSAKSTLKLVEKNLDSLERRFQQAGIDPAVFDNP